jgi:hypothetical protein
MEQNFGLVRCTKTQKPLFAAQQLRGPASTWWGIFVAVQPAGHQVTWDEFKLAFREHYVLEGVLHMKQEEFIRLKQGGDTVMQYLNKFNHLSQYAIDQVNTDLKKKLLYEGTQRPAPTENGHLPRSYLQQSCQHGAGSRSQEYRPRKM